jgi:hypothetical protein
VITHQPWYEKGYRANIVTYTLAFLHQAICRQFFGNDLDLMFIWNRQEVPKILTNEIVKITRLVFDVITDPKRETINVTQWCKRETCWKHVQDCKVELNDNISKLLVSKTEKRTAVREAKKDQHFVSDVEAQTKVLEFGAEFWKQVNSFILLKKLGTPDSMTAIKYAMMIPNKFPSAYQSEKLLELLKRAESEGFKAQ